MLHLNADNTNGDVALLDAYANASAVIGRRANGSGASPTAVQNTNSIFNIAARGYGSTTYGGSAARFQAQAIENWTDAAQGTEWLVQVNPALSVTLTTVATFQAAGCSFTGTTTSDSASAGQIGEYISSVTSSGSTVSLSTGTAIDVTTLSITAGDWDVWGEVWFEPTTVTSTILRGYINTVANTVPADVSDGTSFTVVYGNIGGSLKAVLPVAACRVSLASTTTYRLGAVANFTAGTLAAHGKICARRRR